MLDLQSFYTVGEKEARAWDVRIGIHAIRTPKFVSLRAQRFAHLGATAAQAAGVIHSDFEKFFIRAETIAYNDFLKNGSEKAAKEAGVMRSEGKDYIVQDGDIFHFLFNK